MKHKLYLDDIRTPVDDDWIVVRNYEEFVEVVKKNGIDSFSTITFDHDLGDTAMEEYFRNVVPNSIIDYNNIKEKTGMDCARWLVNHHMETYKDTDPFYFPNTYSHSANPIGAANIIGYLNNYLKNMKQPQTCVRVRINHT